MTVRKEGSGVSKVSSYAIIEGIENLRRNRENPDFSDMVRELAKLRKEWFDAYVAAGFTEAQAMEMALKT